MRSVLISTSLSSLICSWLASLCSQRSPSQQRFPWALQLKEQITDDRVFFKILFRPCPSGCGRHGTWDVGRQCAMPCFRTLAGTVRGRCTSRHTSGQSRLGPREFGEDVSERTDFCTIHPTPFRCTTTGTLIVPLEPLAQRLEAWLTLPSLSRWLTRTIRLGYTIQFARRPPKFNGVLEMSVAVRNAPVLREEIAVLLAKDAIEPVPPAEMRQGFHSPSSYPRKVVNNQSWIGES